MRPAYIRKMTISFPAVPSVGVTSSESPTLANADTDSKRSPTNDPSWLTRSYTTMHNRQSVPTDSKTKTHRVERTIRTRVVTPASLVWADMRVREVRQPSLDGSALRNAARAVKRTPTRMNSVVTVRPTA